MRSIRLRNWVALAAAVVAILAVDQLTKWLVRQYLPVNEAWAPIPALARIFTITHVQNTGVAFGQLAGAGWLFMIVNVLVFFGVIVYYPRIPDDQRLLRVAAPLIMAGAVGNVIDRLRTALLLVPQTGSIWTALPRASVTDFFDFHVWPVFNISDLCIVSGVIIVAIVLWRQERAQAGKVQAADEEN